MRYVLLQRTRPFEHWHRSQRPHDTSLSFYSWGNWGSGNWDQWFLSSLNLPNLLGMYTDIKDFIYIHTHPYYRKRYVNIKKYLPIVYHLINFEAFILIYFLKMFLDPHTTLGRWLITPILQTRKVSTRGWVTCSRSVSSKQQRQTWRGWSSPIHHSKCWREHQLDINTQDANRDGKNNQMEHKDSIMKKPKTFCVVIFTSHSRTTLHELDLALV